MDVVYDSRSPTSPRFQVGCCVPPNIPPRDDLSTSLHLAACLPTEQSIAAIPHHHPARSLRRMPRSPDKRWPSPSEREDRNRRPGAGPPPYTSSSSSYDSRYGYKRDERRYEPLTGRYEDERNRRSWTGRSGPVLDRERDRRDVRPEYPDSYKSAYARDSEISFLLQRVILLHVLMPFDCQTLDLQARQPRFHTVAPPPSPTPTLIPVHIPTLILTLNHHLFRPNSNINIGSTHA